MMAKLTQKRLKELFEYDRLTGIFINRTKRRGGVDAGTTAGTEDGIGYLRVSIDGCRYKLHRLAWLYVNGYFPENFIDHINRNRSDNRIDNLREATRECNTRNCGNFTTNTSSVKGVTRISRSKKWRVRIHHNKKMLDIGCFGSFDDAVCARLAIEQCFGWSGCDSNSPAYQYVQNNIINN